MKIPDLVIPYAIGVIVWAILFFVVKMSFQWSVVIGIIVGFLVSFLETAIRGDE